MLSFAVAAFGRFFEVDFCATPAMVGGSFVRLCVQAFGMALAVIEYRQGTLYSVLWRSRWCS